MGGGTEARPSPGHTPGWSGDEEKLAQEFEKQQLVVEETPGNNMFQMPSEENISRKKKVMGLCHY